MRIEVTSLNKKTCTSKMVGKIVFKADNEVDAVQLAALARDWANLDEKPNRISQYREEVLKKFCRDNNVQIVHDE